MVQPLWETIWSFLKKVKLELPYDSAIPLLQIYLKTAKAVIWKDIYIQMFIAAVFTHANIWKNLSAGRNINNLRYADDTTLMGESEEELKTL